MFFTYQIAEIPFSKINDYNDFIGYLCKNKNGVYNIPQDADDAIKSFQYFGNWPYYLYVYAEENEGEKIKIGDWLLNFKQKSFSFDKTIEVIYCDETFYKENIRDPYTTKYKRIISTTNPGLKLPLIPNSFLFEVINNRKLQNVELEFNELPDSEYKLMINNNQVSIRLEYLYTEEEVVRIAQNAYHYFKQHNQSNSLDFKNWWAKNKK